jgi:hypothetical protein
MIGVVGVATVGLLTTLGLPPGDKEVARTAAQVGLTADDLVPLGLDAQLDPWWAIGARIAPCAALPGQDLDDAVRRSDALLADLEAVAAVSTLQAAIDAVPCTAGWVEPGALKVALEWWGHGAQLAGDEETARRAYAQLAGVDPGWRIRPPPGSGFEDLWDGVRAELAARPFTTLAVHGGQREVRWDGEGVAGPTTRLEAGPGRHLLQWAGPDGAVEGAWILVSGGGDAALITSDRADAVALLAEGMGSEAGQRALTGWLGALQTAHGLLGLVVLDPALKPPGGYRLDAEGLRPWTADAQAVFTMRPDRARILLGAEWLSVQQAAFHYVAPRLAFDVKIVGPLHVTGDVSVGFSRISHPRSPAWDGGVVILPGVGLGLALRRPTGLAQPFLSVTGGIWSAPAFEDLESTLDGALLDESSQVPDPELPVSPRVFLDGGVDLVPDGGALVVRVAGGVGWGLGLQLRAGVLIGGRFGR